MKSDIYEQYRTAYYLVRGYLDVLAELMNEDYPEPGQGVLRPTKFQVDMLTGLAAALAALIEGHEHV